MSVSADSRTPSDRFEELLVSDSVAEFGCGIMGDEPSFNFAQSHGLINSAFVASSGVQPMSAHISSGSAATRDFHQYAVPPSGAVETRTGNRGITTGNQHLGANSRAYHQETHPTDDPLIYSNLAEIARKRDLEDIDRRPNPPIPDASDEPLRVLPSGWKEYTTQGGRSFYFHPENGVCQWKPPRLTKMSNPPSAAGTPTNHQSHINSQQEKQYDALGSSMSTGVVDHFTEMSLHGDARIGTALPRNGGEHWGSESVEIPGNAQPIAVGDYHSQYEPKRATPPMSHSLDQRIIGGLDGHLARPSIPPLMPVRPLPQATVQSTPSPHGMTGVGNAFSTRLADGVIKHGSLEKCKLMDNGVKLKKREWTSAYAYLSSGHLLFYKDQKNAEKCGKHYPTPMEVCDLRSAICSYAEPERQHKERRKRRMLSLILASKTEYLFAPASSNCSSPNDSSEQIEQWFDALRQTIASLPPAPNSYPLPPSVTAGSCGSLQRSTPSTSSTRANKFHQSMKSKFRSSSSSKEGTLEKGGSEQAEHTLSKESIIERLLAFFRIRPSMESLRERGIYKPEPVFGSTLAAICTHENTKLPRFLSEVVRLIEEKGLDVDGLYRVNANLASVQRIRCQIDQERYEALNREEDVHVLTGALKLFFRELSEPLFPATMTKDFMSAIREPNIRQRFAKIDDLLTKLPTHNKETLTVLIKHLEKVSDNSRKNRMQIHNLAIVFGPSLFSTEDRPGIAMRKLSNDKAGKKEAKKKVVEKKTQAEETGIFVATQPNLAYKIVVYGQIVEFILNEARRFQIFCEPLSPL